MGHALRSEANNHLPRKPHPIGNQAIYCLLENKFELKRPVENKIARYQKPKL